MVFELRQSVFHMPYLGIRFRYFSMECSRSGFQGKNKLFFCSDQALNLTFHDYQDYHGFPPLSARGKKDRFYGGAMGERHGSHGSHRSCAAAAIHAGGVDEINSLILPNSRWVGGVFG